MLRRILFALIAAAIAAPASAEEAPAVAAASAPVAAFDMLQASAAAAKAAGDLRWAFTAEMTDLANESAPPLTARFDPRRPEGEQWTAMPVAGADLTKDQQKALKKLNKAKEPADGALVYDGIGEMAAAATLASESDDEAVFDAPVIDDETPEEMLEALTATLILDKKQGHIREVRTRAVTPFKPVAVARVESFEQAQTFVVVNADWPPLLAQSDIDMTGKAMMKSFAQKTRIVYSDYEPVEIAARAED